jgi:hypothetical protein
MREISRQGAGGPRGANKRLWESLAPRTRDTIFLLMRPGSVSAARNSSASRGVSPI